MKRFYEKAEITITAFDSNEVLAASSVLNDKGEIELPLVPAQTKER